MRRAARRAFQIVPLCHCRAAVLRGKFLPAVSGHGRSAGPEAGRGVSTPPSLPLDSTHPATRKGLLAPFRPQRRSRSGKMLAASLNAFFALLRLIGPSAAAAAAPRRGAGCALSVTFGDTSPRGRGKKHSRHALGSLSKERQEACPPRSWLSLRESWREAPERVGFPPGCLFSPLTRMLPAGSQRQQMPFTVTALPVKK